MAVPEASMNKQDGAILRKNQIGLAWQTGNLKPKTEACPVQGAAHRHFGPGVPASDARHHARAGCLVNDVCQYGVQMR